MPFRDVDASPKEAVSKPDAPSLVTPSAMAQPFGLYISAVATTQIAFFEFMSQCTLAWIKASSGHPVSGVVERQEELSLSQSGVGARRRSRAVNISARELLTVPVITGLEETLSDQFIKPRPVGAQESEVLALWERSNEFEVVQGMKHEGIAAHRQLIAERSDQTIVSQ